MRTIIVEPYNPKWAEEFEKIKSEILPLISDNIISLLFPLSMSEVHPLSVCG